MNKTINEIITEGQKKRHDNHVNAGKNIKKKWKQEVIEQIKKTMRILDNNNNLAYVDKWNQLECELNKLK
jgi:hypothetical protein